MESYLEDLTLVVSQEGDGVVVFHSDGHSGQQAPDLHVMTLQSKLRLTGQGRRQEVFATLCHGIWLKGEEKNKLFLSQSTFKYMVTYNLVLNPLHGAKV